MKRKLSIRSLFVFSGIIVLLATIFVSMFVGSKYVEEINYLSAKTEIQKESQKAQTIVTEYLFLHDYSSDSEIADLVSELKDAELIAVFDGAKNLIWSHESHKVEFDTLMVSDEITTIETDEYYLSTIPITIQSNISNLEQYTQNIFSNTPDSSPNDDIAGYAIKLTLRSTSIVDQVKGRYLLAILGVIVGTIGVLSLLLYRFIGKPLILLRDKIDENDIDFISSQMGSSKVAVYEIGELVDVYLQRHNEIVETNQNLEGEVEKRTDELAKLNDQLRVLAFRATHDSENITKRIAAEIHDNLCSIQISLKRRIERFLKNYEHLDDDKNTLKTSLNDWIRLTDETDQVARNIIGRYQSSVAEYLGLEAGIEDALRHNVDGNEHIEPYFINRSERLCDVDPVMHEYIVRIVQESVRNVVKHTKATRVSVSIDDAEQALEIRVSDNGGGFDRQKLELTDSYGLQIMEERAAHINGCIQFINTGTGTDVVLDVPLEIIAIPNFNLN